MSMQQDRGRLTVAIVAASGNVADDTAVARAIERLKSAGCRVLNFYDSSARYQRFGGTDEARAAQLHAAASNPDVDIVLALRGGYGLSRLLPALDLDVLGTSGKLFVGHSDFTALHMALLARTGTISFAGPMVADDFSRPDPSAFTLRQFWDCVTRPEHRIEFEGKDNLPLDVSGILWGGNLTMLAHLAGTPYMPRIEDGILFLEDVNEQPFRVERMLLQLWHAGLLRQKAIVLGDFSNYRVTDYDNGYDFDAMVDFIRGYTGIPVLRGLPFGHIRDKVTLAVGCQARLQSDGRICSLTMSGYPVLDSAPLLSAFA